MRYMLRRAVSRKLPTLTMYGWFALVTMFAFGLIAFTFHRRAVWELRDSQWNSVLPYIPLIVAGNATIAFLLARCGAYFFVCSEYGRTVTVYVGTVCGACVFLLVEYFVFTELPFQGMHFLSMLFEKIILTQGGGAGLAVYAIDSVYAPVAPDARIRKVKWKR